MIKIVKKKYIPNLLSVLSGIYRKLKCKHTYHTSAIPQNRFKIFFQNECRLCGKITKQVINGEYSGIIMGNDLKNPQAIVFPTKYLFSTKNNLI